ncbi:MAG: alpha/beta fold hydrolase [Anaerolineae bacterium]|nr:alpha/beta fold hydrolase [Anaerolineae bacterium]
MTQLEVIERLPVGIPRPAPLLFIHGAWHGAWCWEENFLPYFVRQGYRCYALSLRGHGTSEGKVRWASWKDYLSDIHEVARTLDLPPVLIGHSMGGYLAQKYLEFFPVTAAVLLASIPAHGILPYVARFALRHPGALLQALVTLNPYHLVGTLELAHEGLFSQDMPTEQVKKYWEKLTHESFRMVWDTSLLALPKPKRVLRTPVMVIAAEEDRLFHVGEEKATARAYHAELHVIPAMAHDVMLEKHWQEAADLTLNWLHKNHF